jgi:DNA-binding transcriptional ArsR family regulator
VNSITNLAEVLKALSESNRLRILKMLELRSLCVCEITAVLQLATSTVSKHLSILRAAGLIHDEQDGKWINYHLTKIHTWEPLNSLMNEVMRSLTGDSTIRSDARVVRTVDRQQVCHAPADRE